MLAWSCSALPVLHRRRDLPSHAADGGSARLSAEVPNISLAQARALLGEKLVAKASNGAKQLKVQADPDEVPALLGGYLSKSLRYGACLELPKVRQAPARGQGSSSPRSFLCPSLRVTRAALPHFEGPQARLLQGVAHADCLRIIHHEQVRQARRAKMPPLLTSSRT